MHAENTQRSGPQGAFHGDKVAGAKRASFGVDNPGDLHPVHHGDHQGDDPDTWLENRRQGNRQQQCGKRHHQIGKAHQQPSDTPLQITCAKPYQDADQYCSAVGDNTDE
ncbi:hypothetical protein AI2943V1_5429 (plasmid) [Klebsiella oxytoca]|nr:hypothetical protein AI2943V1_5429 [Klebsiella oxytoca]CAH5767240.1 hypothetical protein AI2943V1_5429 [Klebsiella oxytoca]